MERGIPAVCVEIVQDHDSFRQKPGNDVIVFYQPGSPPRVRGSLSVSYRQPSSGMALAAFKRRVNLRGSYAALTSGVCDGGGDPGDGDNGFHRTAGGEPGENRARSTRSSQTDSDASSEGTPAQPGAGRRPSRPAASGHRPECRRGWIPSPRTVRRNRTRLE